MVQEVGRALASAVPTVDLLQFEDSFCHLEFEGLFGHFDARANVDTFALVDRLKVHGFGGQDGDAAVGGK